MCTAISTSINQLVDQSIHWSRIADVLDPKDYFIIHSSIHLFMDLSIHASIHPSIHLSFHPSICTAINQSINPLLQDCWFCGTQGFLHHPFFHPSIYSWIYSSMHQSIHLFIYPSIHPNVQPLINQSIHWFGIADVVEPKDSSIIHSSIHSSSIHPSIHQSIHLFIYPSIYPCVQPLINQSIHCSRIAEVVEPKDSFIIQTDKGSYKAEDVVNFRSIILYIFSSFLKKWHSNIHGKSAR